MFVVKYRKFFFSLSIILVVASFFSVFKFGLNLGIDFKGGTIMEVNYENVPNTEDISKKIEAGNLGEYSLRKSGDNGLILRLKELNEEERNLVNSILLKDDGELKRFGSVGPVLGSELKRKSIWSISLVILGIILFIAFVFRKVSKPLSSWKYGIVAIIALIHDIIIPTGVFSFLSTFREISIDSLFVTALLVILGFSIHDTIVVFDRTRENLKINQEKRNNESFENVVGKSISETFTRSINTSLTTLITLVVLYVYGPEATQNFSLALLIGITAGTYSSIFIASPLLVTLEKLQKKD